jgi:hypothetical protein
MRAMGIDRRAFGLGVAAAIVGAGPGRAADRPDWALAASCRDRDGRFAAVVLHPETGMIAEAALPARGHEVFARPGHGEFVAIARRPGTFGVVFARGRGVIQRFSSGPGRHFFGHGVFSPDGRLLYTTEDDVAAGAGVIGVRDASADYRPIGEYPSGGIGPHDLALLSDGKTLVVANGGIETGGGRAALNAATMEPSITYLDRRDGTILERHTLGPAFQKLSIRHLAVAARDLVAIGCQVEGDRTTPLPLILVHRRGTVPTFVEMDATITRRMRGYVGSISADRSGTWVCATSPRGGLAVIIDPVQGRLVEARSQFDVSGVAPRHLGPGFWVTTGAGAVAELVPGRVEQSSQWPVAWDNHAGLIRV